MKFDFSFVLVIIEILGFILFLLIDNLDKLSAWIAILRVKLNIIEVFALS